MGEYLTINLNLKSLFPAYISTLCYKIGQYLDILLETVDAIGQYLDIVLETVDANVEPLNGFGIISSHADSLERDINSTSSMARSMSWLVCFNYCTFWRFLCKRF